MNTQEIIDYLTDYNAWRRGGDEAAPQPYPKEVGEFIDAAIAKLREQEAELATLRAQVAELTALRAAIDAARAGKDGAK